MNFLNVNYWESPTNIIASIEGKEVKGFGYMELAGRASIYNNIGLLKSKIFDRIPKTNRNKRP
jgi:hypothetical protein